jgi:hypothetical protein
MLKMDKFGWVSGSALVVLAACAAKGGNTGGLPGGEGDASTESDGGSSSGSSSGSSGSSSGSSGGSSGSSGASTSSGGSSGGSSGANGDDGGGSSGATGDDGGGASGGGAAPTCAKLAKCCPLITQVMPQLGMACSQVASGGMESMCQMAYTMAKAQDPLCM